MTARDHNCILKAGSAPLAALHSHRINFLAMGASLATKMLCRRKSPDAEEPAPAGNIELQQVQPIRIPPDPPQRSQISLTIPANIRSRTEHTHPPPSPNTPGIYVERILSTTPPLQYREATLNVPDPPLSEQRRPSHAAHSCSIDPSSLPTLQLHEVATLTSAQLEGRYSPSSYQSSEASSAYYVYPDNQTPHRSPMPTPPPSPRRATTVSAREVTSHRCECHPPPSPNTPGIYVAKPGYVYLPRTVPSNVPSNSDALHTVAHSHDRPVSMGYVMCPMHTMPSSSSQPSYRPARPGYVENVVKKPPAICIPEDVIDGTSSPVEKVSEDEALRTTLWLVNNGTASDSEGTEESRRVEESTDNTGLCRRKSPDPEEPAPAGNIELQQMQPIQIPPDPPQRSQISLTIPANIRSRTEHTHPPPSPNTPGIYVERILSTTPPLQYREATLNVPDPPLSEQRLPSHAAHSCSIDPSSLPTLQLHEVATLTSAQLEGRYSPSSYQSSEASSAYYVYPDNQTPHRSPMPTPPPSPRRATTVSAREVTSHRCECHPPPSPNTPGIYVAKPGYVYLPRTVPSNVPSNSDALHTVAHSHDRPVSMGYVMCPMHTMPSSSSQPSYRPARPGYVENVVKKPPAICIPEDVIDGTSSPVEKVSEDEALRTTLWLVNNGTASDSEGTEESRRVEESTDNTGIPLVIPESASPLPLGESERLRTLEVGLKQTHVHFQGCEIQPKARHSTILSGSTSVHVFDSHFNPPSDRDMTTSAHTVFSIDHDTVEYGSEGGMYINRTHDITIDIPESAVPEGTVLQLSISAMLYGPFLFPAGVRPVSPILWLCTHPTLTFSKPIEVFLPHYLHCEDQNDTENLMFLKADHNSLIDGKFYLKPADGKSVFKHYTNYGMLHTNHCCFLCIAAKMTEKDTPKTNLSLITAYPRNPQQHPWSVYFGVTYLLPTCMQAFRNQFTDDYHILRARKFRLQDAAERKIEICYPKNLPQQWVAGLNGSYKILASDVDFWSIWNRNPTELKIMEQEKMYPPNFEVIIDGRSAVGNARLTASFTGIECPLVVEIPLLLPASTQPEIPNDEVCASQEGLKPKVSNRTDEQDDTIELRELCLELHTVDGWFKLGIYLGISYSELKIIEVQHHDPHRCRMEMLQAWLNNYQPSWSAVIEALKLLKMNQLAKSLAAKKVSPVHVPLHVHTTSPTPPQGYFTHQPAQPHQTHQHEFSNTGHMRGVRGRSTFHVSNSKAAVTETLC